ncbi:hypothetical protein M407DRAFT_24102 [Tulasnella calospora MUT 4182]|uniref:F-box domain-containing protein n=1 Tax=Tulasnella calospora MUT 4182 TaxID=1051891 RepID=A0A0C3QIH5_9AGAM|nr:hypothetical protein M407DRAFT_24102 [Tulasnella calospora MUT 4182]
MTHINSLPPELLSHIFHIIFERMKNSKSLSREKMRPPVFLNLLLVSSHWHQVAITSPSLWAYIPITRQIESSERARKLMERSLLRSKECSLDIVIELPAGSSESLLKEVAEHAHRWRTLSVNCLTAEAVRILEQIYLPHLFSVSFVRRFELESGIKLDAPNLKKVRGPVRESDALIFEDPLPIFTDLRYSKSSNNTELLVSHLRRSQNSLKTLRLSFATTPGTRFSILPDGGTQVSADTFGLSFTALTDYTVQFNSGPWDWSPLHIGHMPLLRHLTVYWYIFEDVAFTSTIPFMPQLLSLQVSLDHGRRFKKVASLLQSATPNLERLCLDQTFPSVFGNDSEWISPLILGDQDHVAAGWSKLVVLRLCSLGIPQWDDLKLVASCRPAFKQVSVDSICWKKSKGYRQDLDALKQHFEVLVTDD